jgi:hypothetical protein
MGAHFRFTAALMVSAELRIRSRAVERRRVGHHRYVVPQLLLLLVVELEVGPLLPSPLGLVNAEELGKSSGRLRSSSRARRCGDL